MPRIKRYHPVSHDFVRDPEVIELRKRFGDWAGFLWLEMLSIADRNEGYIKGTVDNLSTWSRIVWVEQSQEVLKEMTTRQRELSKWSAQRARKIFDWMAEKGWILPKDSSFFVCKYRDYHKTREQTKSHEGTKEVPPFLPSEPSDPTKTIITPLAPTGGNGLPDWFTEALKKSQYFAALADGHGKFWQAMSAAYDPYEWLNWDEQVHKADAWIAANPMRAPTQRGLARFLRSWFERAVERQRKEQHAQRPQTES